MESETIESLGFVFERWLDTEMFTDHQDEIFSIDIRIPPTKIENPQNINERVENDDDVDDCCETEGNENIKRVSIIQQTFKHTSDHDDTGAVVI